MKITRNKIMRCNADDHGIKLTVHCIPLGKTCPGYTHKVMVKKTSGTWLAGSPAAMP